MTVIVGLETTIGEKAVVLGADRLCVNGELLIAESVRAILNSSPWGFESCFKFLEEKGLDKVRLKSRRKIKFSEENNAILLGTGTKNEANEQIEQLLLNPDEFLKNDCFLIKLLCPMEGPKEFFGQYLKLYKEAFNIYSRLRLGVIPEVRRIFDLHIAKRRDIGMEPIMFSYWDRNYHPVLSEYLFAKVLDDPRLFDIALTGAVVPRKYFAKGCGSEYALKYMRERLGTDSFSFFYPAETKTKKEVDIEEAVNTVKGAIEYTNFCSDFCKGLDYAILRKDNIETHFDDAEFSREINFAELIERRVNSLNKEISQLTQIKKKYLKRI